MYVWHNKVHRLFGESLHYFVMSVDPFNVDTFRTKLSEFMISKEISSFCFYPVFGEMDVVLRVWLPGELQADFAANLQEAISTVRYIGTFAVTRIASYWCWGAEPDRTPGIVKINKDDVNAAQRAQSGSTSASDVQTLQRMLDDKMLLAIEPEDSIKCFVALALSSSGRALNDDDIRKIGNRIQEFDTRVDRVSIYLGFGLTNCILKLEVKPDGFFNIWPITERVADALGHVHSTTYICSSAPMKYETNDAISEYALRYCDYDLNLASLFPALYETHSTLSAEQESQQDEAKRWAVKHKSSLLRSIRSDDGELSVLRRAISGVLHMDENEVYEALQSYFRALEIRLRGVCYRFGANRTNGDITKLYKSAGINQDIAKSAKHMALGSMLTLCSTALKYHPKSDEESKANEDITGSWEPIAELRNYTAHGSLDPFTKDGAAYNWQNALDLLIEFFPKVRKLLALVEDECLRIK